MTNALYDITFLEELAKENQREIFVRISALDNDDYPLEQIEGKVTDGSINIDGKSLVRRTCSLTMTAENVNINSYYWGLKNKFTLEIGLKNNINSIYPNIIWFLQGTFIITQFNTTQTTNKWTIKIQGKDKMCLLNGDLSGNLPHEVDFGKEEYHDLEADTVTYTYIPIKNIIRRIVQEFGGERPENIIINDIDDAGLILLEYINEMPSYLYKEVNSNEYKNIIMDGTIECLYKLKEILTIDEYNLIPDKYHFLKEMYVQNSAGFYVLDKNLANQDYRNHLQGEYFKGAIEDEFSIVYENLLEDLEYTTEPTFIKFPSDLNTEYTLAKIEYGDIPGYFLTDLTYAYGAAKSAQKDLIAKTGESLTSVLNKIRDMLVHFEYYYDIHGKFIFQKKKDYIKTPWNTLDNNDIEYDINLNSKNIMFSFLDSLLISSFQNSPKITNIKNDYAVWGSYNTSGTEIPIHMRYAIDKKPTEYKPIRPLKEEIHTIIKNGTQILSDTITYKYYDAPEIEPYNDEQLIKITDKSQSINGITINKIHGTTLEGYEIETTIYPYFAKIPYSTNEIYEIEYKKSIILENENGTQKTIELSTLQSNFEKQTIYTNFEDYIKATLSEKEYSALCEKKILRHCVDWRELIYQMALDYRKYNYQDDFLYYIIQSNPQYPTGKTGYEQYYIDLEGFWRTLYDPNPAIIYEPIGFNEVKKYTQLLDDNKDNDSYDTIYIENGYRPIEFNDITHDLSPVDLYCFSSPKNGSRKFYPYIGSENCHLEFEYNYYLNENNKMNLYTAANMNSNGYAKLNGISLNNIYIKNEKSFTVLKNQTLQEYYTTYHDLADNGDINNRQFKVPAYPHNSNLDKYSDDYFKVIDVAFKQLLKENEPLEGYYIQSKKPLKLLDIYSYDNWFKNNYYNSNLIMFAYQAQSLISKLNSIKIENYQDIDKTIYLEDYINAISDYVLQMNQYQTEELIHILIEELNSIVQDSIIYLENFMKNFQKNQSLTKNLSCLVNIFEAFNENLSDIKKLNANGNMTVFAKVNLIKNIYNSLNNNLIDINKNWVQVKNILDMETELKNLSESENQLTTLKEILINQRDRIESIPESNKYENGQLDLTLSQINFQLSQINNYKNNNDLDSFITNRKEEITTTILNPIKALDSLLKIFYEEENVDNSINLYLTTTVYDNFFLLLNCIKGFTQLLVNRKFTREQISSIISYTRTDYKFVVVLKTLHQLINSTYNDALINTVLTDYVETTKDFQEYLITDTVNNFNYIESDAMQYEKIKYCRGIYNYNHDKTIGNFWSYSIESSPQLLLFWFDFLDADDSQLANISIPAIGDRIKVITDKNVQAINYKTIPQVIFKRVNDKNYEIKSGYTYININNNAESFFRTSSKAKSAKERIEELLYEHSYSAENVTIAAIPVYHLEPNHHIFVRDDKSNINGEYIVNKITIPLSYKKTMNITASKAVSSIV